MPRGPWNGLHDAANRGSASLVLAFLDAGMDIDKGDPQAWTALMLATYEGYSHIVRILLNRGADTSISDIDGYTALHYSAQLGHLGVTELLLQAGSDLEARSTRGVTPLHAAAQTGHSRVMSALIEAGANPNSYTDIEAAPSIGHTTPLLGAAFYGSVEGIKILLAAKADPSLGGSMLPLDVAAAKGHADVVRELMGQVGIEGCGGKSGGADAFYLAAERQDLDIMSMLTDAGVVDAAGRALRHAATHGREGLVKLLLQQHAELKTADGDAYANARDKNGRTTPVVCAIEATAPRIVRLLVDAGADTSSVIAVTGDAAVDRQADETPLARASRRLREKAVAGGKEATEEELHGLEAIRRLLLRVDAVHAVSWLWLSRDVPSAVARGSCSEERTEKTVPSAVVTLMLPGLKRRAARPAVVLSPLFRFASKP